MTADLAVVVLVFLLAGTVKGVIGMGLPSVSLALLTATFGLHQAMALMLVPSLVTNLWQAAVGGHCRAILTRTWAFMACATLGIGLGALALTRVEVGRLVVLLGLLLVVYAVLGLWRPAARLPRSWEPWAGPLAGAANGVLAGMTGSFVVPGVPYLQAIGLPRDVLVQAMGILFTASTLGLAVAMGGQRLLGAEVGLLSAAGVVPAAAGMVLGQRLRRHLGEATFRRVFLVSLAVLGAWIAVTA